MSYAGQHSVSASTRWILVLSAALLILFGGLVAVHSWWVTRQKEKLDVALKTWNERAEYFTLEELQAGYDRDPPAPNAADAIDALPAPADPFDAFSQPSIDVFKEEWVKRELLNAFWSDRHAGYAGRFDGAPLEEAHYDAGREFVATNAWLLVKLRDATGIEEYYRPMVFTGVSSTAHLMEFHELAGLLIVDGKCAVRDGDYARFNEDLGALGAMAGYLASEPMLISQVSAGTLTGYCVDMICHALCYGKPTVDDLRAWAAIMREAPSSANMRYPLLHMAAVEHETAMNHPGRPAADVPWRARLSHGAYELSGREFVDRLTFTRTCEMVLDALDLPYPERRLRAARIERHLASRSDRPSRTFMGAAVVQRYLIEPMTTRAKVHCTLAALRLEQHRVLHGSLPDDLEAAVTDGQAALPDDPFTGGQLLYAPDETGYSVYSVGPNGADNGGAGPRFDVIVFRVEKRGD